MPGLQVLSAPQNQPTLNPVVQPAPTQPTLAPKVLNAPTNQPTFAPKVLPQPTQQPTLSPQVQSQPQGQQASLPVSYGHVIDSIVAAKGQGADPQSILAEIIRQNQDAPATQDIQKALSSGADANAILDKIIQDNYIPSVDKGGQDQSERGWLQDTFGPELAGLASGARSLEATWPLIKGLIELAKNDPATLRYALAHPSANVINAPSIAKANDVMAKPIANVKPLAGMNAKEALGTATQAIGQELMVSGGGAFKAFGLQSAGSAAASDKSAPQILLQGLLGGLFGKGADIIAPYIGKAASSIYDAAAPQILKDTVSTVSDTASKTLSKAGKIAGPTLDKVVPDILSNKTLPEAIKGRLAQPVVNALEDTYNEIFTGTKAAKNTVTRSVAQGKDPARFLAENGYVVDVSNGKINSQPLIQKITQDVEPLEQSLNDILAAKSKVTPDSELISLDDIGSQTKQRITNTTTKGTGTLQDQKDAIDKVINNLKQEYGDKVNLSQLNEIKRGQWKQSNVFDASRPQFMSDVHYNLGKASQQTIEKNVTETSVKDLNNSIGDHFDAIKNLKKIDGNAVKGGRLGKYFNRVVGTIVGSHFGPAGTIGGALAGDYISELMQNNAIASPLKRAILSSIPEDNALYEAAQVALRKLEYGQALLPPPGGGAMVQNHIPMEIPASLRPLETGSNQRVEVNPQRMLPGPSGRATGDYTQTINMPSQLVDPENRDALRRIGGPQSRRTTVNTQGGTSVTKPQQPKLSAGDVEKFKKQTKGLRINTKR